MSSIEFSTFHDSQLSKIELGDGSAELTFKLTDETYAVINLAGLSRMLCASLREGNIVLELAIITEPLDCASFLNKLFDLTEEEKKFNPAYLIEIKKKLSNQELVIFHMAPSYGAELVALCENVHIRKARCCGEARTASI